MVRKEILPYLFSDGVSNSADGHYDDDYSEIDAFAAYSFRADCFYNDNGVMAMKIVMMMLMMMPMLMILIICDNFGDDGEVMIVGVLVIEIAMAISFAKVDFSYSKCSKL